MACFCYTRSSGAVVEGLKITGCNGSGIAVQAYSKGSYQSTAILRNLQFENNTGTEGAAVHVGPDAAVKLEECMVSSNNATDSIIHAEAGAKVELVNTNVTNNTGSGVASAGSTLNISGCQFSHNTAIPPGAKGSSGSSSALSSGAAVRMTCARPVYASCQASITNSTFTENRAQSMGGALYFGADTNVSLVSCNFTGHAASYGGAVFADRGSCLLNLTSLRFRDSQATER